jgi:HEAT repeat protein
MVWPSTSPAPHAQSAASPARPIPALEAVHVNPASSKPAAMSNPETYAATRLQEIKADPARWNDPWAWRQEYSAADTTDLRREVVGLARQVGGDALVAVLQQAFASEDQVTRLDASRSLSMLPENRMRDGFALGFESPDAETRHDVMDQIQQVQPQLRAELLKVALSASAADVQRRAIEMITDSPNPAYFDSLLEGLRSSSPEIKPEVQKAIADLVQQDFTNYDEANRWWQENREHYDDLMTRMQ